MAEKLSDYADAEKVNIIKEIRKLSIGGVIAHFIIDITGTPGSNLILGKIFLYCETPVYVTVIMIALYSTGLLSKI